MENGKLTDQVCFIHFDGIGKNPCAVHHELNSNHMALLVNRRFICLHFCSREAPGRLSNVFGQIKYLNIISR